ncbi:MAG: hypothetical protein QOD63_2631 [Actinomycetota bacterium]|nr:hypothetical protein [Actinomycetota bacterium]
MRRVVGASLSARRGVVALAVVVMALGVWQLRSAKVDTLPEFGPPTVEVQTEALGLSSEEVEQLITIPLEQDLLDGVAWLDTISSKSVPGLSSVVLVFQPGTDLYRARQVVQERISQAAGLPNVSRPPQMLQPRSASGRTAMVALSSKELSPIQIGVLARWTIRPRLLAVPGVSNVAIWGQRERQLQVLVDPQKLRDRNVSLERVISSTGNALWVSPLTFLEASTPGTGGFIDTPNQRIGVQHNLPIIKPADLAEIPIDEPGDAPPLKLGDVATVVEDHQPLIGDAIVEGADSGAGYLLVVEKLPNANTSDVTRGVEEALDGLRPGLGGLQIDTAIYRPATYIDGAVHNVTRSVLIGAALLMALLALVFFDWRTALAAVVGVALSFLTAALVLDMFGRTFDLVVLAGLLTALGAVVYDAVSSVDTLARARRDAPAVDEDVEHSGATIGTGVVLEATLRTGRTALWATVVFVVALSPIFFMQGLSGDSFYPPMALACLAAMVASLVVATTVTPALSALLAPKGPPKAEPPLGRWSVRAYDRVVAPCTRTSVPALVAIGVVVLAAVFLVPRASTSLLPTLQDPNLLVQWDAAPGTSLPEMDRITARVTQELRSVPGVREVGTQVGQALLGDRPVGSDSAQTWISLEGDADYAGTVAEIERVLSGYPGLRHEVLTYAKQKLRAALGRTNDEITVRVFGTDLGVLHDKADDVRRVLAGIDGVDAEHVTPGASEPAMEIQVDLAKARDAGIKPGDVRRAAATLLSSIRVGNLFQDQKVFDVQIWSTPETRSSLSSVQDLLIDTPSGTPVRLGDVATVRVKSTPPVITHEDVSRYVDVTATVKGGNVGDVAAEAKDRLRDVDFPLEYHAELVGDYATQQDAQGRMAGFALAAAVAIFLLLQAAFGSWRLAGVTFLLLPVAIAGAPIAAWIEGGPWTLATAAGTLAVLAVALRSFIALVGRFQRLRGEGVPFGEEVVDRGTREHLAPIVATAVATAVVLLPMVVSGAGREILRPMGIAMLGGLVTTTLASVFLVPALYLRFGPRREPEPFDATDRLDDADRELTSGAVGG